MSKTPKPTNLKASTDAPKTGTQKKALNVVQVVDVDSDEEEVEGKVLLEKQARRRERKRSGQTGKRRCFGSSETPSSSRKRI